MHAHTATHAPTSIVMCSRCGLGWMPVCDEPIPQVSNEYCAQVVLRGLVSAYDEVHRPGRLTAAANAHAALDASAPTLKSSNKDLAQDGSNNNETSSSSSSSSSSPTLVGKCARVALGRGCEVAITEDWCEGGAASDQLSSSEDSTEEAKSEEVVMNSDLKSNAPHEFTRLQPADLPSLEETMHVSSGFAKHLS